MERGLGVEVARNLAEDFQQQCLKNMPALLDETGSFTASSLASRITKSFDLHGGGVAIDAGILAAPASLMCCVDQLRSGDNDAMICIAAHQDMSINRFDAMHKLGLLSERTLGAAPFDKKSAGSFPAEGCGVFILRRLSDACESNEPSPGDYSWRGRWYRFDIVACFSICQCQRFARLRTWNQMKLMLLVG